MKEPFITPKWEEDKECVHCKTTLKYSEKYDTHYCPECLYWTELLCPERDCCYCKNRPKYPKKNI